MRILYSHRIQSRDGQSVHLEAMVAALRAAGHEVLVVGPGLYQQAEFGGESRLVALIRARLPPFDRRARGACLQRPGRLASAAGRAPLPSGHDL